MNLIVETQPKAVATVTKHDMPIILKGIFMEAGRTNGNNRQYDPEDLARAVDEFQTVIKEGRALAELEHPETTVINPDRACARITSLKRKGNQWLGEAVVLAADPEKGIAGTPCGTLLASLLQYGTKVGWSSRGVGEIDANGVVRDFHLVTVDCVLTPSIGYMADSNACRFVDGVLESTDFVLKHHPNCQPIFEALNKDVANLSVDNSAKYEKIAFAFNKFISSIKGI